MQFKVTITLTRTIEHVPADYELDEDCDESELLKAVEEDYGNTDLELFAEAAEVDTEVEVISPPARGEARGGAK